MAKQGSAKSDTECHDILQKISECHPTTTNNAINLENLTSTVSGDDKIEIVKHSICIKDGEGDSRMVGVEVGVINTTDRVIGSALFEATFTDTDGRVLDTVEHKTFELLPNTRRSIHIFSSGLSEDTINNYHVRLIKTSTCPEPIATGNEKLTILKHSSFDAREIDADMCSGGINLSIRNASDSTIATALFEAIFFDIEGNIVGTVKHKEVELLPDCSRAITIYHPVAEPGIFVSYKVKTIKTTTADVEKVHFRKRDMRLLGTGEIEVFGTVKNISQVETNAAIVVTFYNQNKESIGTRVKILKNFKPSTVQKFQFKHQYQQEGDIVTNVKFLIGEVFE